MGLNFAITHAWEFDTFLDSVRWLWEATCGIWVAFVCPRGQSTIWALFIDLIRRVPASRSTGYYCLTMTQQSPTRGKHNVTRITDSGNMLGTAEVASWRNEKWSCKPKERVTTKLAANVLYPIVSRLLIMLDNWLRNPIGAKEIYIGTFPPQRELDDENANVISVGTV